MCPAARSLGQINAKGGGPAHRRGCLLEAALGDMETETRLEGQGSEDAPATLVSVHPNIYTGARDRIRLFLLTLCVLCDIYTEMSPSWHFCPQTHQDHVFGRIGSFAISFQSPSEDSP